MCSDVLKGTVVVSKGLGALFRPASLLINFPLFPSKDNNNFEWLKMKKRVTKYSVINFKLYKYLIFKPHEPLECQAKQTYSPRGCTR